jgi:cell division protein FtsB
MALSDADADAARQLGEALRQQYEQQVREADAYRALRAALEALVVELEGPAGDDSWMKVPDDVLAERCRISDRITALLRADQKRR